MQQKKKILFDKFHVIENPIKRYDLVCHINGCHAVFCGHFNMKILNHFIWISIEKRKWKRNLLLAIKHYVDNISFIHSHQFDWKVKIDLSIEKIMIWMQIEWFKWKLNQRWRIIFMVILQMKWRTNICKCC